MISVAAGLIKGLQLQSPKGDQTRPTSERLRAAVFNVLRNHVWEGGGPLVSEGTVADIFAGSGAFAIEALSQGAAEVHLVENHPKALDCLRANLRTAFQALGGQGRKPRIKVYEGDVTEAYGLLPPCRLVFSDPPYHQEWLAKMVALEAEHHRLREGGVFVYEAHEKEPLTESLGEDLLHRARLQEVNRKNYGDSNVIFFVKVAS